MKKIKFNTYNDGLIEFGNYVESYGEDGNALENKEFIFCGKLYFSYQSIREQDRLKFDNTGKKITAKVKTPYINNISSSNVIKLNNELYSIRYIDPDIKKQNLYIYLTELENELNKHIEIFKQYRTSALANKALEKFKVVWSKVEEVSDNSSVKNTSQRVKHKKKVTIRYLKDLDININTKATLDFQIKYKDNYYNIDQILNLNDDDELLEITLERIY